MIKVFLTVGVQLPFDRLLKKVDEIAESEDIYVVAQCGDTSYRYENLHLISYLGANEYEDAIINSDIVIAHAGMGTILKCLEFNQKLIVVPRLCKFGEHRNDHQLDTVSSFKELSDSLSKFRVCTDLNKLGFMLKELYSLENESVFFSGFEQGINNGLSNYIQRVIYA